LREPKPITNGTETEVLCDWRRLVFVCSSGREVENRDGSISHHSDCISTQSQNGKQPANHGTVIVNSQLVLLPGGFLYIKRRRHQPTTTPPNPMVRARARPRGRGPNTHTHTHPKAPRG